MTRIKAVRLYLLIATLFAAPTFAQTTTKTRDSAAAITQLKDENAKLRMRIQELEKELAVLRKKPAVPSSQSNKNPKTVVARSEDGDETRITSARILIESSRGFEIGRSFQDFDGVDVTSPVAPKEGVQIKPERLLWSSISKIEWIEVPEVISPPKGFVKAKVTMANGKEREVFLFAESKSGYANLFPIHIKIEGTTRVGGADQPVTFHTPKLKSVEFHRP